MVSMSLPVVITLSMALNHSGHMPNEGLQNSMVFHEKLFIYYLKECEFRLDYREENLYDKILTLLC